MNAFSLRKIAVPVSLLFPPGTVKIAANITVVISAATSMQDDAVSFIHFSPSLTNSLCSSVNSIPDLFLSMNDSNVKDAPAFLINLPDEIWIRLNKLYYELKISQLCCYKQWSRRTSKLSPKEADTTA
ncbi:hypothetical protein H5410_007086 [Solanum commersonii]|uniref:Uncharacterized protein n=1 Tax=Solanum commersonii TaxID=4109 RepID=A0A9J6AC24_SOLCO|nr:hypothetical protein H5410_007086 [Solanum commersonii]